MRLIDADALCRHLSDWQFGEMTDGKHDAEYEVINKVVDGIEKEPTVERKRGKWIDLGKDRVIRWQCSECGRKDTHIYNYCPACGADMRGENNG